MPGPTLTRRQTLTSVGAAMVLPMTRAAAASRAAKPLVFAHRGASALRPEHTLAAYAKGIADGADYIEPDLVITRDGVLVARHENNIADTTDVSIKPQFAARRTTKTVDGEAITGWFAEDFTLDELKTLRAVERLGAVRPESRSYDGQFQLVTLDEIIDFVASESAARGRVIGIVPEIKHSTYFHSIGRGFEDAFVERLGAHAYTRTAPVEIQSFETANLRALRKKLGKPANVRLMQLVGDPAMRPADIAATGGPLTYGAMAAPAGLREIARYADVVAPNIRGIIPVGADKRLGRPTSFVDDAHAAGLLVRTWTFRPENRFLPADLQGPGDPDARYPAGSIEEMRRCIACGLDGFFTDDPALGRAAVDG